MPETTDIWDGDGFTIQTLTAAINSEPYRPGQLSALDLFEEDGVSSTRVSIEQHDGKLSLVEPTSRGGPGETTGSDGRSLIGFDVPHYERDDAVMAEEVQNRDCTWSAVSPGDVSDVGLRLSVDAGIEHLAAWAADRSFAKFATVASIPQGVLVLGPLLLFALLGQLLIGGGPCGLERSHGDTSIDRSAVSADA